VATRYRIVSAPFYHFEGETDSPYLFAWQPAVGDVGTLDESGDFEQPDEDGDYTLVGPDGKQRETFASECLELVEN
jgi:hypothetical protein